jgi:hypothetical protein
MESFEVDESASRSDNKNRMAFLTTTGFKRSVALLIILTITSIIYTFINKLSDSSFDSLFGRFFSKLTNMSTEEMEKLVNLSKSTTVRN